MSEDKFEASRERRRRHLETALEKVSHAIKLSRDLADIPEHREAALARIAQGEQEIIDLERELAALSSEESGETS